MARVKKLVPEDALGYGFTIDGDYYVLAKNTEWTNKAL